MDKCFNWNSAGGQLAWHLLRRSKSVGFGKTKTADDGLGSPLRLKYGLSARLHDDLPQRQLPPRAQNLQYTCPLVHLFPIFSGFQCKQRERVEHGFSKVAFSWNNCNRSGMSSWTGTNGDVNIFIFIKKQRSMIGRQGKGGSGVWRLLAPAHGLLTQHFTPLN